MDLAKAYKLFDETFGTNSRLQTLRETEEIILKRFESFVNQFKTARKRPLYFEIKMNDKNYKVYTTTVERAVYKVFVIEFKNNQTPLLDLLEDFDGDFGCGKDEEFFSYVFERLIC